MGEKRPFDACQFSAEDVQSLSKLAKMETADLRPCLDFFLKVSDDLRTNGLRKLHLPASSFARKWKIIDGHLSKAEAAMARCDRYERLLFNVIVKARLYERPDPTVEKLFNGLAAGTPHATYSHLLNGMTGLAKIMRDCLNAAPAHRPALSIRGKDWGVKDEFALFIYSTILQSGGKLSADRNEGGSLYRFLDKFKRYSHISPPHSFRRLERITRLADKNSKESPA